MAGSWTTKLLMSSGGASIPFRVWDESGTGAGPFTLGAVAFAPQASTLAPSPSPLSPPPAPAPSPPPAAPDVTYMIAAGL